jgi:hypothetical protein
VVPRNFFLLIVSDVLTKLGDAAANPKTTLTWMMDAIGAPVALTGLLVPVRESGSLIPQLVIAAKDVLGKMIPKTRRGRVNGYSTGIAGLATLGVGAAVSRSLPDVT